MKHPIFYTYAWLRKNKQPYYIGKGHGNRAWQFRKKGVNRPLDKSRIILLKQNLTEKQAFDHERYMIFVLGRKDKGTGILYNRTDGGDGCAGLIHTEEHKRKTSVSLKGRVFTENHKQRLSQAQTGEKNTWFGVFGENNPSYGRRHSKQSIEKMSKAKIGEKNPCFGRKWWTDGTDNILLSGDETPPVGWRRGRTKKK